MKIHLKSWYLILGIIIALHISIFSNGYPIEVLSIKYIFYTITGKPTSPDRSNPIQGKELDRWFDTSLGLQPDVFDVIIKIKNRSLKTYDQKVKVELSLLKGQAIIISNDEGERLDLEQTKLAAKWESLWIKELSLTNLKVNEVKNYNLGRVKIFSIIESCVEKNIIVLAWRCTVSYKDYKVTRIFNINFLD
ncbi:MAG: hypothetical protein ACM3YE_08675 [Bacteroidota bacterium]